MAKILKDKSIYYNDVNLIAQRCKVKSRSDIPKELNRIIVSPMQSIIGKTFALIPINKVKMNMPMNIPISELTLTILSFLNKR
jgi:hypothetical protein